MSAGKAEIVECGVDYITATATHAPRSIELRTIGYENIEREAANGNDVKKWRTLGYVGRHCGSASVGVGEQGTIVRLSSAVAREYWQEAFAFSTNVTRLDLQVTVRLKQPSSTTVKQVWSQALKHAAKLKRPAKLHMRGSPLALETIEFGSRQSDRYGRCYDKYIESGLDHYLNCVRFELELKRRWAISTARALAPHASKDNLGAGLVAQFFGVRGVSLPSPVCSSEIVIFTAPNSDASNKLVYFRKCVRSPVQKCIEHYGLSEVLDALGISETLVREWLNSEHPQFD